MTTDRREPIDEPHLRETINRLAADGELALDDAERLRAALPELVAEVIDPYRTGLRGRIEIVNSVPASLPLVLVDRTLTARAFSNIVENALHAMPGRGSLTIHAAVEPADVRLEVTDTGVGMDREALERVFEPYFSTKTTGTGLGLPIARRNIELNGGSVEVRSVKGEGTTVVVRLPIGEPSVWLPASAGRPRAAPES